jgi:enoyl-CoA hydratase/carnithine racemase
MPANLIRQREGRVVRLTLNRPEKRNALDLALCRTLVDALAGADADRGVGAILLDGAGTVFCSGMDLSEVLDAAPDELIPVHGDLFSIGARLRTPLVAAVHGGAIAGGLGLALNAHFVVAGPDARFGLTETRIGLWPYAIFLAVARAAGERRAVQLALEGNLVTAPEALRLGLVDRVSAPGSLAEEARELAGRLAGTSGEAVWDGLGFVQQVRGMSAHEAADSAAQRRREAQQSADFREGVRAFLEKRSPHWPSHRGAPDGSTL